KILDALSTVKPSSGLVHTVADTLRLPMGANGFPLVTTKPMSLEFNAAFTQNIINVKPQDSELHNTVKIDGKTLPLCKLFIKDMRRANLEIEGEPLIQNPHLAEDAQILEAYEKFKILTS